MTPFLYLIGFLVLVLCFGLIPGTAVFAAIIAVRVISARRLSQIEYVCRR